MDQVRAGSLSRLAKLVAHVNLRGKHLVDGVSAIELHLEIAYSRAEALTLRNQTSVVADADMTEQGFRHLGVLHDE